jgi:elongation factor P--beta-lysine ligase
MSPMIHVDTRALSYQDECVLNYIGYSPLQAMKEGLSRSIRGREETFREEDSDSDDITTRLKTDRVTTIRFKVAL